MINDQLERRMNALLWWLIVLIFLLSIMGCVDTTSPLERRCTEQSQVRHDHRAQDSLTIRIQFCVNPSQGPLP